jgi:hypothetical protein
MNIIRSDKNSSVVKKATYELVVDADGKMQGIRQLEIKTDRTTGVEAMKRLAATSEVHDDLVGEDGWTMKQRRILSCPPPLDAHILSTSQKWDAAQNKHDETKVILLDYDVVWTLFESLFEGQYSVKINHVEFSDPEIMPAGSTSGGEKSDDMPGQVFYARAHAEITLHLKNGQTRSYEGVGVSFAQLRLHEMGNVYSVTSARRTSEKGAVKDAKREALANIGRVFRRAFEDGTKMQAEIEEHLLQIMAENSKPKIHMTGEKVPAPQSAKSAAKDEAPDTPAQTPEGEDTSHETAQQDCNQDDTNHDPALFFSPSEDEHIPVGKEEFADVFLEFAMGCESVDDLDKLVANNTSGLKEVDLSAQISEIRGEIQPEAAEVTKPTEVKSADTKPEAQAKGDIEDGIPDFDVDTKAEDDADDEAQEPSGIISVEGKSGKKILAEFKDLFNEAKSDAELDRILTDNKAASRKMTPKQLGAMAEARAACSAKLQK